VLVVAGVLILGGGAAFAISQIAGGDDDSSTGQQAQGGASQQPSGGGDNSNDNGGDKQDSGGKKKGPAVDPSTVTVAVLNGTTVPGLAAQIADQVKSFGFQIGTVANGPDQQSQRAESVVLYAKGHEREAMAVGRKLKITQREPVDPESQGLAGDATVVVIAGGDRSKG